MTTAAAIAGVLFAAAVFITIFRMIKGPSILDRMISTDVLLATMLCGFGGFIVVTGRVDLLPVMLVISSLGFVGSVAVSRYVSRSEARLPMIGESRLSAEAHEHALSDSREPGRHRLGPLFAGDVAAVSADARIIDFADGQGPAPEEADAMDEPIVHVPGTAPEASVTAGTDATPASGTEATPASGTEQKGEQA